MLYLQNTLDSERTISTHTLLRNSTILFSVYYYAKNKNKLVFLFPIVLEIIIELFHSNGYSIDPVENKTKNLYSFFDCFWSSSMGSNDDLTEGKFDSDISKDFDNAQIDKKLELVKLSGADKGVKILEIGCGNGSLLKYLTDAGADAHGISISKEQVKLCREQGLNVDLLNFFEMGKDYYEKYDSIICSGVIEHLPNIKNRDNLEKFYYDLFQKFSKLLNPNSKLKKIVITCVHFRDDRIYKDLWSRFNVYILERANGGWYPKNKDFLIKCSDKYFDLDYKRDITNDYYITTYHWTVRFLKNSYKSLLPLIQNFVVNIVINPYYLHILIEKLYSWQWQFADKNHSVLGDLFTGLDKDMDIKDSPMIHQLIVLKMKK